MKADFIFDFAPSWFAVVMGTGILAMTSRFYAQYFPLLELLSIALAYLNTLIFVILLVPWLLRWIFFRSRAIEDLKHPIRNSFYPTLTIAVMILSVHLQQFGFPSIAFYTWIVGAIGTIVFSVLIPYEMFKKEEIVLDHISPAWFIPPVALIAIPLIGGPYTSQFDAIINEFIVLLNYFGFGAGFFLYLALQAIVLYRFILHRPLPNTMAPTIWITLGPIGAGIVALNSLVTNSLFLTVKEPFFVFGLFLWGFGIWWLFITIMMTIHYLRRLKLPYSMSWWAFIFPLGAYVAGSHSLSNIFGILLIDYTGFVLYWLLLLLWIISLVGTLRSFIHKDGQQEPNIVPKTNV